MNKTPDERGVYHLDCGCRINTIMQARCALHNEAPNLLALLKEVSERGISADWHNRREQAIRRAEGS